MGQESERRNQAMLVDVVPSALSVLDDEAGMRDEMWEIRSRHAVGRSTHDDHRRYRACWRALALCRSLRRWTVLSPEFDEQLRLRVALLEEIQHERARLAIDAVFEVAPEGEAPATGAGVVPR